LAPATGAAASSSTEKVTVEGVEFTHPTRVRAPITKKQEKQFQANFTYKNKAKSNFSYVFVDMYSPDRGFEPMHGKNMKRPLLKGKEGKLHLRLYRDFYLNFQGTEVFQLDFCTVKGFFDDKICVSKTIEVYSK
jgi:hypothetical protein